MNFQSRRRYGQTSQAQLLRHIMAMPANKVYCLTGFLKYDTELYKKGTQIWYIGESGKVDGFNAYFVTGLNRSNKWQNSKMVAKVPDLIELKFADVQKQFADDHGLYRLTKDQIVEKMMRAQKSGANSAG